MKNGNQLKIEGMNKAAKAQDAKSEKWTVKAYRVIESVAHKQSTVHVDDVAIESEVQKLPEPENANAWGSVWTKAIRNELITRSGNVRPAGENYPAHKHKHARSYPVYASLVYGNN